MPLKCVDTVIKWQNLFDLSNDLKLTKKDNIKLFFASKDGATTSTQHTKIMTTYYFPVWN